MTPAAPMRWRPLYDADETKDQFAARQRQAFGAFELAWREGRVSPKLKAYYDQVVRDVGTNAYAWWRETRWAEVFGVSTSTIKRVVAALVKAKLIRRERCYGRASRTYVTAYDAALDDTSTRDLSMTGAAPQLRTVRDQPTTLPGDRPARVGPATTNVDAWQAIANVDTEGPSSDGTSTAAGLCGDGGASQQPGARFCGSTSEPTIGSLLVPDSMKNRHTPIGAGGYLHPAPVVHPATQRLLEREGVGDFVLASQLLGQPVDELHAVSQYLDTQHTIRDRPRLFAWLATHGFGSKLLAGRGRHASAKTVQPAGRAAARRSAHDRPSPAGAADWVAHVCPTCQVRYVEEAGTLCFDCTMQPPAAAALLPPIPDPAPSRTSATPLPRGDGDPGRAHQAIWEQVRATLDADAACSDLALWLAGSTLLDVTPTTAVVGVGNVFLRDELQQRATPALEAALAAACGRAVSVSVVVEGSSS